VGGVGGGGGGGPSYALYLGPGNQFLTLRDNVFTAGDGGDGGQGGATGPVGGSNQVTAGFGGVSRACYDLDDPRRFVCGLLGDGGINVLVDARGGARGAFD
jgi:hypothetical protein